VSSEQSKAGAAALSVASNSALILLKAIAGIITGSVALLILGIAIERLLIRHFYSRPHEDQLLVTFGLGICFVEIIRLIFSSQSQLVPPPAIFQGITNLGFMFYPTYRLAVVGIVAIALGALFIILYRTRLGMIVRAGIEDSVMVDSLGINVYRVFMVVFGIGAMAAGFAGIVNAPVVSLTPDMGEAILVQTFVPGYAYVMLFAAMTLVLVVRPHGLLGVQGRE